MKIGLYRVHGGKIKFTQDTHPATSPISVFPDIISFHIHVLFTGSVKQDMNLLFAI